MKKLLIALLVTPYFLDASEPPQRPKKRRLLPTPPIATMRRPASANSHPTLPGARRLSSHNSFRRHSSSALPGARRRSPKREWTPLHRALMFNKTEEVPQHLKQGVRPNSKDQKGRTPVHIGVDFNSLEALQELFKDVRTRQRADDEGNFPLHNAVKERKVAIAQLLLDNEKVANCTDAQENTALHYAETPELAQLLVEKGGNPGHTNTYGKTPLDFAELAGLQEVAAIYGRALPKTNFLTSTSFSKEEENKNPEAPVCSICCCGLEEQQETTCLYNCNHAMHQDCAQQTKTFGFDHCPQCKANLALQLTQEEKDAIEAARIKQEQEREYLELLAFTVNDPNAFATSIGFALSQDEDDIDEDDEDEQEEEDDEARV